MIDGPPVESQTPPGTTTPAPGASSRQEHDIMASKTAVFDDTRPIGTIPAIPLADIAPWAVFASVVALILLYFVSTEQGAFALFQGMYVHEFVHDGRHLLGFPCH
ncbi:CbtB domain-containing protein [Sphingomonas arantia]|uniref:CbtB domain-containing protein n=1 Tax=Sphingomonas arantia TaxID=1460676 RepID=A0ABW4TUJ8_9SPHN